MPSHRNTLRCKVWCAREILRGIRLAQVQAVARSSGAGGAEASGPRGYEGGGRGGGGAPVRITNGLEGV
jgi:hypothetical protein